MRNVGLNGANGAYAAATNTIYLSHEFVEQQDLGAIVNLLLEEIVHFIDGPNTSVRYQIEIIIFRGDGFRRRKYE